MSDAQAHPVPPPVVVEVELPPGVTLGRCARVLLQLAGASAAPHDAVARIGREDLAVTLDVAQRGLRAGSQRIAHTLRNRQTPEGG